MTHYSATSLEQIADELERWAKEAADAPPFHQATEFDLGRSVGLGEAATLVRNTRLADPAREAMVKALEPFANLSFFYPNDEDVTLVVGTMKPAVGDLRKAEAALKLAKDNGHV